jgi:hypothetical protein
VFAKPLNGLAVAIAGYSLFLAFGELAAKALARYLKPWRRPRPGRIPSRGDGDMELVMTVPSGSFGADPAAAAGEGHGGRRGAAGRRRQGAREGRWGSLAGCSSCTPSRTLVSSIGRAIDGFVWPVADG